MNSSPVSERSERLLPSLDTLFMALDGAMRTLFAEPVSARPHPAENVAQPDTADTGMQTPPPVLSAAEQREVGALMRVNHVGEVCAQALYAGQALGTRDTALRAHLQAAGKEETDHLAWTLGRLRELNDRPSLLNPLWYAGAFTIGFCASRLGGDVRSLGFVVETERQVEAHLDGHLDRLPTQDWVSRAIVEQMKADEVEHAVAAEKAGALPLPAPMRGLMRAAAKVMTTVAHRV